MDLRTLWKRGASAAPAALVSILLFVLLVTVLSDLPGRELATVAALAAAAWIVALAATAFFSSEAKSTGDGAFDLLTRVTAGDLDIAKEEVRSRSGSQKIAIAVRALVLSLERTIGRFAQLSNDVKAMSDHIGTSGRTLARNARSQEESTRASAIAISQINENVASVQEAMSNLAMNAEETSTSILEMSASIDEVTRISETLAEFVDQTATGIEEMIASINQVASNTESFSSFAIETASSIVQMNATTQEIGRSARSSSELARFVTDAATEGRAAVEGTVDGMRKIQEAVEQAKNALTELGAHSLEIGEIVRVIDDIAGQTNLLALNAAIIAAQAGDRGKGFAVVADEIRDLSERTSVSTEEIRTLIQNVQRGVENAAGQMTLSADRVSDGVSLTVRAEQVLGKILELTSRSTSSISEIARATEEQSRGSKAATEAIEEITKMVQQTANATAQQSQTSMTIGEQAAAVRDYTRHLKRAMQEQESGSRAISRAMENIMTAVSGVLDSTKVLGTQTGNIVGAIEIVERGTRENNFIVTNLNQAAGSLRHEANLLSTELGRFRLAKPVRGGELRTATILPQALTLDPIYCQFMALFFMHNAIHETLVRFGEGAELVPGLAERWEVADGRTYRFHLRKNARFHNGRPIVAEDVRKSFLRLMSPSLNSPGKWLMREIVGGDYVIDGKGTDAGGIIVIDDHTVELVLNEPLAFFPLLMTMPETAIIPVEETANAEQYRLRGVGAGPFKVEEVVEGKIVRFTKFDGYYDSSRPRVDRLSFRLDLHDSRDVANEVVAENLDIAHRVPLPQVVELRKDPRYAPYFVDTVSQHTSYLGYDTSSAPFNRLEVRQAFNHAINKQRINERVFSGLSVVANSLLPPGIMGHDPNLRGYDYDPDRARRLLRDAGHGNGLDLEYWTWDTDEFRISGQLEAILEDLEKVGVRVKVSSHSSKDVRTRQRDRSAGLIFLGNWFADFPDPDNFFFIFFHSTSASILGLNYHSADLDARIENARRNTDIDQRAEIYRDFDRYILEQAPLVPMFHERLFVFHRPEVRGLRPFLVPPPVRYHEIWLEQ
jgi:ABC-type transport system substrate-binding protein/methyl-accepting chemotaxis protein